MASPEFDAHGRRHRAVEVDIATFPVDHDGDDLVLMSSGVKVRREDMAEYQRQFVADDEEADSPHLKEVIVFGSAAVISFAAIALARRRLNRNN